VAGETRLLRRRTEARGRKERRACSLTNTFSRRSSLDELANGTYRFLPQLVRQQSRPGVLDLRFRTDEAALYLGQDCAMRLQHKGGAFTVEGPSANALARISSEGRVQADYCSSVERAVIATQAAFAYPSKALKQAAQAAARAPYEAAAASFLTAHPSGVAKGGPSFGERVDALEITSDGRLAVIEIKAGTDAAGVYWAPAQASFYAAMFGKWLERSQNAHAVLSAIHKQRHALNLAPERSLLDPVQMVPVMVVGLPINAKTLEVVTPLAQALHAHLLEAELGSRNLEVWGVEPGGEANNLGWFE
jgi:hypothetical protein